MSELPEKTPYRYGWKIHLTLPHDASHPQTQQIVDFCNARGLIHKVGVGGTAEEGKGVTIYVGARDKLHQVAHEIHSLGLATLAAVGDALETDHRVVGNVWARFDTADAAIQGNMWTNPFNKYGAKGISDQIRPLVFYNPKNRRVFVADEFIDGSGKIKECVIGQPSPTTKERMLQMSHRAHTALFGDFYTAQPKPLAHGKVKSASLRRMLIAE